jgi:hypothetical protein
MHSASASACFVPLARSAADAARCVRRSAGVRAILKRVGVSRAGGRAFDTGAAAKCTLTDCTQDGHPVL